MDQRKAMIIYRAEVIVFFKNIYGIDFSKLPVQLKTLTTAFKEGQQPEAFCRLIADSFCLNPIVTKQKTL